MVDEPRSASDPDALINRLIRRPPRKPAEPALHDLYLHLLACSQFYREGDEDSRRLAVIRSHEAVMDFLRDQGFPVLLLDPLSRPIRALDELDDNRRDPMFAPRRKNARPKRTISDAYRTAVLACLANLWLEATKHDPRKVRDKLAEAARKMKGEWFGIVTDKQLATARSKCSQADADDVLRNIAAEYAAWILEGTEGLSLEGIFLQAIRRQNALPRHDTIHGPKKMKAPLFHSPRRLEATITSN